MFSQIAQYLSTKHKTIAKTIKYIQSYLFMAYLIMLSSSTLNGRMVNNELESDWNKCWWPILSRHWPARHWYQPSKTTARKDRQSLDWSFPKMKRQSYPWLLVAQLYLSVKANILYMVESHTVQVNPSVLFKRSVTARMVAVVMTMIMAMIQVYVFERVLTAEKEQKFWFM